VVRTATVAGALTAAGTRAPVPLRDELASVTPVRVMLATSALLLLRFVVATTDGSHRREGSAAAGERVELPFSVEIPAGAPPTLRNGDKTSVVWQARVSHGASVGWSLVGVLDPESLSAIRNRESAGLLDLFD